MHLSLRDRCILDRKGVVPDKESYQAAASFLHFLIGFYYIWIRL